MPHKPMRDFDTLMQRWRALLAARGHPTNLVWLPHESMVLRRQTLYVREPAETATERDVEIAVARLDLADPGVFLLAAVRGCSYATLLMDPFGSDDDTFVEEANWYFWADPYADEVRLVKTKAEWLWLRHVVHRVVPRLSSLDYAFSIKATRKE
jgi:hypothetical protein